MRKPLLLALSLLGLFDSAYLWWVYTSPTRPIVCMGTGCDVVRASRYATVWGVSLPFYGVVMYATLAALIFAHPLLSRRLEHLARTAVAGIAGTGFLVSLYLTGLEAFVLDAWCAWCVVSALAITLISILACFELVRPAPLTDAARALEIMRRHFAVLVAALLVGVPAFILLMRSGTLPPILPVSAETLSERLVHPHSHFTGNPQATLTVVEFGDFQCAACSSAEDAAREIRKNFGNQIRFVFRHFPLARVHPQAEKAAEASECAAEQGKFWEVAEKFFQGQADLSDPALARYVRELGLDPEGFRRCLSSGAAAARVRRDAEDGRALGVRVTPTFFVGQRMIEGPLEYRQFADLVTQELARTGALAARSGEPPARQPDARSNSAGRVPVANPKSSPAGSLGSTPGGAFSRFQTSATACSEEEAARQQPTLIRTLEARRLLEAAPNALFVDVRGSSDFKSGRIPGAINLPVNEIEQRSGRLPKDRNIVLYESGLSPGDVCASSRAAGRVLLTNGFSRERVKVYQDGLAGWEKAGLSIER